jgi:hypothetical protein
VEAAGIARMPAHLEHVKWSGEGDFTQTLIDWFLQHEAIAFLRVEDSVSTRADVDYNLISNEIFVKFHTRERVERDRVWGVLPRSRTVRDKLMTLEQLESVLGDAEEIGIPDYADEGMIQYLRTERVIPPYQTKGYKLIELVRIYEVGTPPRRS